MQPCLDKVSALRGSVVWFVGDLCSHTGIGWCRPVPECCKLFAERGTLIVVECLPKSKNTTFSVLFHISRCPRICPWTKVWSIHYYPFRKPACSWRSKAKTAAVMCWIEVRMENVVDDSKSFCLSSLACSSVISSRHPHSMVDPDFVLSSPVDCQSPVDLLVCLHACHSRSHLGFFCKSFSVLFFVSSCKGLDLYRSPCSEMQHCLRLQWFGTQEFLLLLSPFLCCLPDICRYASRFGSLLTAYHRFGWNCQGFDEVVNGQPCFILEKDGHFLSTMRILLWLTKKCFAMLTVFAFFKLESFYHQQVITTSNVCVPHHLYCYRKQSTCCWWWCGLPGFEFFHLVMIISVCKLSCVQKGYWWWPNRSVDIDWWVFHHCMSGHLFHVNPRLFLSSLCGCRPSLWSLLPEAKRRVRRCLPDFLMVCCRNDLSPVHQRFVHQRCLLEYNRLCQRAWHTCSSFLRKAGIHFFAFNHKM